MEGYMETELRPEYHCEICGTACYTKYKYTVDGQVVCFDDYRMYMEREL